MASKNFNIPASFTRTDLYMCDPKDILVDVNENGANARWAPVGEDFIESLVRSFEIHGQLQPIQVKKNGDGTVKLTAGYNRLQAALRYNELHPDKPMKLQAKIVTCNDEEAYVRSILENKERRETSPMDDAFNQRELREKFGYKDKQIADLYQVVQSQISTLKKLLLLPRDLQEKVHKRLLTVQAAVELSALSEDEQRKVVGESTGDGSEKVNNGEVIERVRQKRQERGDSLTPKKRTAKQVLEFMENIINTFDGKERVTDVAEVICQYLEGSLTDEEMREKFPLAVKGKYHV